MTKMQLQYATAPLDLGLWPYMANTDQAFCYFGALDIQDWHSLCLEITLKRHEFLF